MNDEAQKAAEADAQSRLPRELDYQYKVNADIVRREFKESFLAGVEWAKSAKNSNPRSIMISFLEYQYEE